MTQKKDLTQHITQLKFLLKNNYFPKEIMPITEKKIVAIEPYWYIIKDFVEKDLWFDKYLEILFDTLLEFLEDKKTKWAKILLKHLKYVWKDKITNLWKKIINWKITKEEKEKIEQNLYKMVDTLVAPMIKSHPEGTEKAESSFYWIAYLAYPI